MQFNFQQAIDNLNKELPFGDNFAFKMARTVVTPGDYLFNQILPQQLHNTYHVTGGSMRIIPSMLGTVSMDTPYPKMGGMSAKTFFENTIKMAGAFHFPEQQLRQLQEWAQSMVATSVMDGQVGGIQAAMDAKAQAAALGLARMMLKAQWDTYEWLRGQALMKGAIDNWVFNGKTVNVDYEVPAAHKKNRTSGDAYHESGSLFWTDIRFAHTKLQNMKVFMNLNTFWSIVDQAANNIRIDTQSDLMASIVRDAGTLQRERNDQRDRLDIGFYNKSGSLIDAKTGEETVVPFLTDGYIIIVGEEKTGSYELLEGSTADPENTYQLGYTHIAPTVEGGRPGFWSRVFTPENLPYQLRAETASNGLPVMVNPKRLIILKTEMP